MSVSAYRGHWHTATYFTAQPPPPQPSYFCPHQLRRAEHLHHLPMCFTPHQPMHLPIPRIIPHPLRLQLQQRSDGPWRGSALAPLYHPHPVEPQMRQIQRFVGDEQDAQMGELGVEGTGIGESGGSGLSTGEAALV